MRTLTSIVQYFRLKSKRFSLFFQKKYKKKPETFVYTNYLYPFLCTLRQKRRKNPPLLRNLFNFICLKDRFQMRYETIPFGRSFIFLRFIQIFVDCQVYRICQSNVIFGIFAARRVVLNFR